MTKTELIEIAEAHGYGAEAAKVLFSMSPKMIHSLIHHATMVEYAGGKDVFAAIAAHTKRAIWTRQLLTSNGQNREMRRLCRPTELGYRVIGLYEFTKGL